MKHENIQTPVNSDQQQAAELVPLSDLYLSDLNPRQEASEEGIQHLADSILACGLIQNLAGLRDDQGKVAIVAGGRRFRALKLAVKENASLSFVPVRIAPDVETARKWANAENSARQDLDPADEIRAYGKMAVNKTPIHQISKVFAVSEAHVRRRLALAHLPDAVLDAVKAESITLQHAQIMTISDDEAKILEALEYATSGAWFSEHDLRNVLTPKAVSGANRMATFVGEEAYCQAGGKLARDLFEDTTLFENPDILEQVFAEKLKSEADVFCEAGGWLWSQVITETYISYDFESQSGYTKISPEEGTLTENQLNRLSELTDLINADAGTDEDQIEYDALEETLEGTFSDDQKSLAGVVFYVDFYGNVRHSEGYIRADQYEEAIAAGVLQQSDLEAGRAVTASEKPEYSQKFRDDMKAIRLGALQTALLSKPELALDLLGFVASPDSGSYSGLLGLTVNAETNAPDVGEAYDLDPRIGGDVSDEEQERRWIAEDKARENTVASFQRFQEAGKKHRNAHITEYITKALCTVKSGLMEHLEQHAVSDVRSIWTPTAQNCFKRLNASQLEEIYAGIAEISEGDDLFCSFSKLKKGEKAEMLHKMFNDAEYRNALQLTDQQETKIATWVPDCI